MQLAQALGHLANRLAEGFMDRQPNTETFVELICCGTIDVRGHASKFYRIHF